MIKIILGFTMIELIFVIVIIGILAAVAIPKLAATRDDAKISSIVANARTFTGDLTSYYTSQGSSKWSDATLAEVSNVPLYVTDCSTPALATQDIESTFLLCDEAGGATCLSFEVNATAVTSKSVTNTTAICKGVDSDPAIIGMTGGKANTNGKITTLGGVGIVR